MAQGGRENREAPRRSVHGNAVIRAPDLRVDCLIRDLSVTGARLEVPNSDKLPDEFNLLLVKMNSSRHVILRWQDGNLAGVEFSKSERVAENGEPALPATLSTTPDGPQQGGIEAAGPEKRIATRLKVLGHCVIMAPGLRANGVLRDISATGAKLGVSRRVKLPPEFHILSAKAKSPHRVLLRWREGDLVGVEFCEPITAASGVQEAAHERNIWEV